MCVSVQTMQHLFSGFVSVCGGVVDSDPVFWSDPDPLNLRSHRAVIIEHSFCENFFDYFDFVIQFLS